MKKRKLKSDEACDSLSRLDCGDCTLNPDKLKRSCSVRCTSSGKSCARRPLSSTVPFCLQHFIRVLEKKIPWPNHIMTQDEKLFMIKEVIHTVKTTARRTLKDRDRLIRNLYVYTKEYGLYQLDDLNRDFYNHFISPLLIRTEKIDTKIAVSTFLHNIDRDTEAGVNIILNEFGHPSIYMLKQQGRWIDDRKIVERSKIYKCSLQEPIYIWCHDIDSTEILVNLFSIRHIVVVGTFEIFVRKGINNNDNIFYHHNILKSIVYLLPWIQKIGSMWMSECGSLKHLDFTGLTNLTYVGEQWMSDCDSLTNPNFMGLINLYNVDEKWMYDCDSLTNPSFTGLNNLYDVGDEWMHSCQSLMNPNFIGLNKLQTVGTSWMADCESLINPYFFGLHNLLTVGHSWMWGCRSLTTPDFGGLHRLWVVGHSWMLNCFSLTNPNFIGLNNLKLVYQGWMANCISLVNPNFIGLHKLWKVGDSWMWGCNLLVNPSFLGLNSLEYVGDNWMWECASFVNPNFTGLNSLKMVGENGWVFENILLLYPYVQTGIISWREETERKREREREIASRYIVVSSREVVSREIVSREIEFRESQEREREKNRERERQFREREFRERARERENKRDT